MAKRICLILSPVGLGLLALLIVWVAVGATPTRAAPLAERQTEALAAPVAAPLQQAATTPTYVVSDSLTGGIVYDWEEVSDSGTVIALYGDDNWGSVVVPIGFYLPFYGNIYQTFRASTNGYIYFGGDAAYGAAVPTMIGHVADPNNFIAPFGTDLYRDPEVSRIYVDRQGWRTVIEFVDMQWCCDLNDPHTFEIILYPDGRILTQYRQVRFLSNPNVPVVAGIENADGSDGLAYYEDWFEENTALDDGLAVLYDPGDSLFGHIILDAPVQTVWGDPGETGSGDVNLVNLIGFADIFSVTYGFNVISSSVVPDESMWPVGVPVSVALGSGTAVLPIPNTGSATFQVTATIPLTAAWPDLVVLQLTVTSAASPTISNTIVFTYGVAQRNLFVEKWLDSNLPPAPGGYFRYGLSVTNDDYAGSGRWATAQDVQVTDSLPLSATFISWAGPGTIIGPITSTNVFTWNVGDMAPRDTEYLEVRMWVPTSVPTGTVLTNTAWTTMLGSIERGPFDDNLVTHTLVVTEPRLIFYIDKFFPGPNEIGAGQIATYTVDLVNQGNMPVTGTIVTDILPENTIFHGTTWPTWTWSTTMSRTLILTVGDMLNGDWNGLSFQIGVSVPATTPVGTEFTNTVQVTTTAPLSGFVQAQGDSDSETIQVIDARGDVWVAKQPETLGGNPVVPEPGRDYTFWINYGNGGYVTVYTVTLTDTLPSATHVSLLDAGPAGTASPDTSTPGQVVWHIPELAPGASGWARVRILIDENTPTGTQLTNTAEITAAAGFNISPTNDLSFATITLRATDVTVNKWVTPTGTLEINDWVTYTVRFSNTDVLTATGVRITDTLYAGLTDVQWLTEGHSIELLVDAPPLLVWRALSPLDTGQGGLITITGQLDPAFTWPPQPLLTNRAEIHTARGEEPVNKPNVAQVSNLVALASPYVVKTGPTLALPDSLISYTIQYGNPGLLPAEGVRLTDTLPVSTTYVRNDSLMGEPLSGTTGLDNWLAWDVGAIPSNTAGLTFTLVVSVSPAAPVGAPLYNTIVLSSTTYDGDRTDNESVCVTPVGFDLSGSYKQVNGTDGLAVVAGTPVTYTIVLTNRGPFSATSVLVRDPVPADTSYVANSLSGPGSDYGYDPVGDLITWTGVVSGNSAVTISFQVTVADAGPLPRGTLITNTAFISDGVQTLQASVPVTVSGPDLDGSYKTVNNPQPVQGQQVIYTIVLANDGEVDASARVTDVLPLEVLYAGGGWASSGLLEVNDITGTGTISMGGWSLVTWTGTVTVGERVTLTLPVTVVAEPDSNFDNTAYIDDGAGVVLMRSVTINMAAPNLDLPATRKEASPSAVVNGERVTYTITLYNGGDGPALSAWMTDTLQGGTYGGGGSASSGVLDDSNLPTITWNGSLASGDSVVIAIPVVISATPGSDVLNVAQISDGYNPAFNRSTSVHVYSPPDISASRKAVDPSEARIGDSLDYVLTVDNDGELSADFSVTDTLDADTVFVGFQGTAPGSYGYAAGMITWTGTANGMSQVQLAFQATISPSALGAVTNTARFDDGAGGVYTDTAITLIIAPQLNAAKRVEPEGAIFVGTLLTYTIAMSNTGGDVAQVSLSDTIPAHTLYVGGSAQASPGYPPPLYDGQAVTWQGNIAPDEVVTLTFGAFVEPSTLSGTLISNVAWLQELSEPGPRFSVTAVNSALPSAFSADKWSTPVGAVHSGDVLNYGILLTNALGGIARVVVTDPIPLNTTYISMSAHVDASDLPSITLGVLSPLDGGYTVPSYDAENNWLIWQGDISPRSVVTLTFAATVNPSVPVGVVITNTALVNALAEPGPAVAYQAWNVVVGYDIYLPLVLRSS